MTPISGFCEKCNKFRKRHCDGDRNTCMSILFDTIEALQQENEQLRAKLEDWKHEVQCHMDEVIAREKQIEQLMVRVARMRELLTKAYDEIEKYKCLWKGSKPSGCDCPKPTALQDEIEQILAEIDTFWTWLSACIVAVKRKRGY